MNIVEWTKDGIGEIKKNSNIVIKIADELISIHKISLPKINYAKAKKIIPFELEPKVLDDIENLEFVIKKDADIFNVFVISKNILQNIKQTIKHKKLNVIGAYPNFMFLPYAEDGISYYDNGKNVIFRDSKFSGSTIDKELFFAKFTDKKLIAQNDYSSDYNVVNFIKLNIDEFMSKNIKPWGGVIAIIAIILVLSIIDKLTENNKLAQKLLNLQNQNLELFQENFPDVTRIVDIKIQTEQKLKSITKQQQLTENDLIAELLKQQNLDDEITGIIFDKKLNIKKK